MNFFLGILLDTLPSKTHLCYLIFIVLDFVRSQNEFKIISYDDLLPTMDVFNRPGVISYSQLLFDIPRYQLIVGARDYMYRLSLEGLRMLEETHWPAEQSTINTCMQKGQTKEDCHNFIRVLLMYENRIFTCGTNAFSPECTWRDINALNRAQGWEKGVAKCPYSPHSNSTALMTAQGDYYIASALDFSAQDHGVYKIMGKQPYLRTVQYDPKWLNEPSFVASYEIGNFTYFFFREIAVEYINCGKVIYSRVGRMCKNDKGGQYILKDNWTTFLKARLNCSIPGPYPFYYNEIQSVFYVEQQQIMYATFTTAENSIYGTAVCAFNLTAIHEAFNGPLKYQNSPKSAWERQFVSHQHFQCQSPGSSQFLLDSEKYQLTDNAVQSVHSRPVYVKELERLTLLVVDIISTKHHDSVHVMYVSTLEGILRKLVIVPDSSESCLVEELNVFSKEKPQKIRVLKLLKDTSSLYIGTDESVLRVPLHRCKRFRSKSECLNSMDPYCGWNEYQMACTTAPHRNPLSTYWAQNPITCLSPNAPVDGGWGPWSSWFQCSSLGVSFSANDCWCQKRECNMPTPINGGKLCEGVTIQVTNCTQDGQWTDWSAWSSCSQTCGNAIKTRRRTCGNPAPAFGGHDCDGPNREEVYCANIPPCPAASKFPIDGDWSPWGPWSECSSPCGGGAQVRDRRCDNPAPQYGGHACVGCSQEFRTCNAHLCQEVKKSAPWTPWMRVNTTKEGYFEQRFRFSCRANLADADDIRIGHVKKEERFCLEGSQSCLDSAFLNIDGDWSSWSDWSPCSVSCGKGIQYRERACDNPPPSGNGVDCKGPSRMDRECQLQPCDDVEGWGEWTMWSLCDHHQEQHRQRRCKVEVPSSVYCVGASRETRMCLPAVTGIITPEESRLSEEDGVHMEHVIFAFMGGLVIGLGFGAFGMYLYIKQRKIHDLPRLTPKGGADQNLYMSNNEWKTGRPLSDIPPKVPYKEATIKRNLNGTLTRNLRTPLYSEESFRE